MSAPVHLHAKPTAAAIQPVHRQGQSVDAIGQLSSLVLLGIAIAGAALACLLVRLVNG